MTNLETMEVPAAHVLRTTYSVYSYQISETPINDWEHTETREGETGPVFVYSNSKTGETLTVSTGSPNGYAVVIA